MTQSLGQADIERVFLSSTFKDLETYRRSANTAIQRFGWLTVAMEDFLSRDERPKDLCLGRVRECQVYVGLFAHRYGFVPDGEDRSITELEYCCARDSRLDCLIFLLHENYPWKKGWIDSGSGAEALARFKDHLKREHNVTFFTSEDDLAAKLSASLAIRTREKLLADLLALSKTIGRGNDEDPIVRVRVFAYAGTPTDVRCRVINDSAFPVSVKLMLNATVAGTTLDAPVAGHYDEQETWDLPAHDGYEGHFDLSYLLEPSGLAYPQARLKNSAVKIAIAYSATTRAGEWRPEGKVSYYFDYDREQWIADP
jgi:hypothetical protein